MEQELRSQRPQREHANEKTDDAPDHVQSSSSHGLDSKFPPTEDIEALDSGHFAPSRPLTREYGVGQAEQILTGPLRAPEAHITGSSGPEADTQTGTHPDAYPVEDPVLLPPTPTAQEQPVQGPAHARSSEAVNDESFEKPPS